jgi:long-chain acyl-CoA synthetase
LNQDGIYEACLRDVSPDDLATIIYTSGTTGRPKGVMLTHRNFIANCSGSRHYVPLGENDAVVSFLPLAHIFERTAGYYFAALCGACIVYAESMRMVARDIATVCPTVVFAVPRFFEKAQARVEEELRRVTPVVRRIYNWAINIGKTATLQTETTGKMSFWISMVHGVAKSLLLRKIRCAFGGKIRFFVSGGAPLSSDLARFFHAAGLLILEGYGLTETSPVIAVNAPGSFRFGSVGRPIPNIRVRIAQDGEIVTSGPCLMQGYYRDPEGTAALMKQGGLYTGDIGCLDSDGFLHVTDRKKDMIVTAGGKNIAPTNIENRILSDNFFLQVLVVGDKRPYLCALIVPNREAMVILAKTLNLCNLSYSELLRHPEIMSQVRKRIDQSLEGLANYERLKSFELLEQEFSLARGELTPTLKMKRRVICEKYKDCIESLYRKTDLAWAELQEPQAPPACL